MESRLLPFSFDSIVETATFTLDNKEYTATLKVNSLNDTVTLSLFYNNSPIILNKLLLMTNDDLLKSVKHIENCPQGFLTVSGPSYDELVDINTLGKIFNIYYVS